ncbi:polysaccharide pyruvyl transferase family protein [Roseomonas xinghualingensis]|uniref:polysaccharide pyruvyl transferase family protein n=1 Tax=Roseomonas xinghualingensis TaxID=2986475 RepID=UPI0021F2022E|nr:polysaccharide pyruvyl transferase family protein [Roseomonas sp. SXEYE001]MCV4209536.1 polysaccharide pyruvyl transferase family protein [Roseomonas sp. SXEYE001]
MTTHALLRLDVEYILRKFRNRRVLYAPNPGNAGDALIAMGTFHCFSKLGIFFTLLDDFLAKGGDISKETVILAGGGNFIPQYGSIKKQLQTVHTAKEVILLPHTIRGNEETLAMLGSNVTLICRDLQSFIHTQKSTKGPTVLLAHDMAFHLDVERLLFSSSHEPEYRQKMAKALERNKIDFDALRELDRVFFMRGDKESAGHDTERHMDLSKVFSFGIMPDTAVPSAWCFLEAIRCMKSVTTDRLHVGIGCAILGQTCTLLDNSYGKNSEIYQYSLKTFFDNVSFFKTVPA